MFHALISWLMISFYVSWKIREIRLMFSIRNLFCFLFNVKWLREVAEKNCHFVRLCQIILTFPPLPLSSPVFLFFIAKQICCRSNSRQTAGRAPRNGLWPNQFIYNWKFSPKATGARSERAPTHYFSLFFSLSYEFLFLVLSRKKIR